MLRMMAISFVCLAIPGRCSLILMPGTAVAMSLYGPPFLCPGFRWNGSSWLGPPFIHKRMHERCRAPSSEARASELSQPEYETPKALAMLIFRRSRREKSSKKRGRLMIGLHEEWQMYDVFQ